MVGRWSTVGFAVFCLLAGSRWLVENAYPSALPPLLGQGFHFAVIGLVALAFWSVRQRLLPGGWWRIGLVGVLLFGVPALVGGWVGSQTGPALFTIVPLCVIVIVASSSSGQENRSLMMPSLVGAAGGFLVLSFVLPTTISGAIRMGVVLMAAAMVALGGVWLHALLREVGIAAGVWLVCGVNAVVLGMTGLGFESAELSGGAWLGELARALVFDLPEVFLLLWLVREMRPERVAARYLFVPLVTVIEGLVLLRPGLNSRTGLGLVLMLGGGSALLLWEDDREATARLGLLG